MGKRGVFGFQDYLSRFKKSQRRNIIHERRSVADIEIRVLTGDDLDTAADGHHVRLLPRHQRKFRSLGDVFLNREWFREVGRTWKHRVVLFGAWMPGETAPVALSMAVRKNRVMVGRYWGSAAFVKNLHFELCYYAPVEYAIREGIRIFRPRHGIAPQGPERIRQQGVQQLP